MELKLADAEMPQACVRHYSSGRLRLRCMDRRGDTKWFASTRKTLLDSDKFKDVQTNPGTGSILILGTDLDPEKVAELCRQKKLLDFDYEAAGRPPLADKAVEPVSSLNQKLVSFTGGELNLPALIFVGLLVNGLYQVARGRVTPLPWYSALWYAFGLFNKSLIK